jgi:hypothetical protein
MDLSPKCTISQDTHKASFNKYKKIVITSYIRSDHNEIKLEFNSKRNYRKYPNTWRQSNTLLNDQWVIKEIIEQIKNILTSK